MAAELPTSRTEDQMTRHGKASPSLTFNPVEGGVHTHAHMYPHPMRGKRQTDIQVNRLLELSSLPLYVFSFPQLPLTLSILVTGTSDKGRVASFPLWRGS